VNVAGDTANQTAGVVGKLGKLGTGAKELTVLVEVGICEEIKDPPEATIPGYKRRCSLII
jgi:hypothetical protein